MAATPFVAVAVTPEPELPVGLALDAVNEVFAAVVEGTEGLVARVAVVVVVGLTTGFGVGLTVSVELGFVKVDVRARVPVGTAGLGAVRARVNVVGLPVVLVGVVAGGDMMPFLAGAREVRVVEVRAGIGGLVEGALGEWPI